MIIRPATDADVPVLREIVQRAYGGYVEQLGVRPRPLVDDYAERVREADVFVAEDDAGIAGLIVLERCPDHVLIDNVAVDPRRQGAGIGRVLLDHAEAFAREVGVGEVRLYTNAGMTRNQSIYRHLGYREDGRRIEPEFQRVFFSKRVPAEPAEPPSPRAPRARIMYPPDIGMDRPRILVTTWRRPLPTYLGERTILDTLDPAYAARVFEAGGLPVLVSRPVGDTVDELMELADGLLLTGGGDVDPAAYGAQRENVAEEDADADVWELALIAAARERELPTLAVCRGAQLLAVAHGGRLAQRLSDGHASLDGLSPEAILSARHPISVAAGSRLERALGSGPVAVNTIHHHEIADPGELEVTATAADGAVIEAVEPRSAWPCVGVQWHPEKMSEPEQARLFMQLVSATRVPA